MVPVQILITSLQRSATAAGAATAAAAEEDEEEEEGRNYEKIH